MNHGQSNPTTVAALIAEPEARRTSPGRALTAALSAPQPAAAERVKELMKAVDVLVETVYAETIAKERGGPGAAITEAQAYEAVESYARALLAAGRDEVAALQAQIADLEARQVPDTLCHKLQQQCSDWGVYWRAPVSHGVKLNREQALILLERALGVEVEIDPELEARQVPAGWIAVPRDPTDEMLAAAHDGDVAYTLRNFGDVMTVKQGPYDHWCAMIAAAPSKPTGEA